MVDNDTTTPAELHGESAAVGGDLATALDLLEGYGHVALARRLRRVCANANTLTDLGERPYATWRTDDLIIQLSAPFPSPGETKALRDELRRRVYSGGRAR